MFKVIGIKCYGRTIRKNWVVYEVSNEQTGETLRTKFRSQKRAQDAADKANRAA